MSRSFFRLPFPRVVHLLTAALLIVVGASCGEKRVVVPDPNVDVSKLAKVGEERGADRVAIVEVEEEGKGKKTTGTDQPEGAILHRMLALRDENGNIPLFGLSRARRERQALIDARGPEPSVGGITPGSWTSIGPGNIGGRVRAVAIHPTVPTTIFVGGVDGGIWRTTNGGTSWAPINDFLANLAVTSIVFQPGNPSVMYAGTGEGFYPADAVRGEGIFKSVNGGTTWTQLPSTLTTDYLYVNRLAMSADGTTLLAATRTGVFRSIDGGAIFTKTLTVTGASFVDVGDVKFLPGSSTEVVASGFVRNAYWSNNGGASFTAATGLSVANPSSGDNFDFRVEIAVAPSSPTTVYASVWGQPGTPQGQVWKSVDSGHAFALVGTPNHLGSQGWYDNAIWVDPTNVNVVIVGGIDLFRSTNAGVNFTQISTWFIAPTSAHADHHIVVAHPGFNGTSNKTVYFGNDGGIYRTDDVYAAPAPVGGGTTIPFTELNNNLGVTQFYGGAGNVATGKVLGGTQDNGTLLYTPAGGAEGWTTEFGGDGGAVAIDPSDPNYMYGEYVYARVHRSTNGGLSASYIYGSGSGGCKPAPYRILDACNATANFISPFVLDPNNPNRLLVGGWSLWRTDDVRTVNTATTGPTWTVIKSPSGNSSISAIAVAQGNPDVIWVGHNNGDVYYTINGTTAVPTWTKVDQNPSSLPSRQITSIAINPVDPTNVYVSLGGFSTNNVYRTTTSGASWSDVTGSGATGLPDVPVRSITLHPTNPAWIYVGSEVGVFASTDSGATWGVPQDGPANVAVYQLFWMGTNLVAATHGRGMFTAPVVTTPPTSVITRSPSMLNFGATKTSAEGAIVYQTPAQTVTVGYTGTAPVWTATSNQPWAVVTGGSGTGGGQFSVSIANPGNVIGGSTPLFATITISAPTAAPVTVAIRLAVQFIPGQGALPVGQVDTPAQGATGQVGAIGVTGWVVDDIGVNSVSVYRPCLAFDNPASCQIILGQNLVFVGNGIFLAGARPDVEAAFPMLPQSYRAGWGFQILTNMLPHIPNGVLFGGQGTFPLHAIATDIEGRQVLLGRTVGDNTPTTIEVSNDTIAKPFGTIDTPLLGQTVSGVVANFGWVLTPDTNTVPDGTDILMPLNGSTMTVYLNGLATAQVAYNQCRGTVGNPPPAGVFCNDDISNIFGRLVPAPTLTTRTDNPTRYRNLDAARGAIGAYNVNTLALPNGLHTIAWGVSDSAGRGEGIGSRFFTVLNGGAVEPPVALSAPLSEPRAFRPGEARGTGAPLGGPPSPSATARPADAAAARVFDGPPVVRGAAEDLNGFVTSRRRITGRTGFGTATPFREAGRSREGDAAVRLRSLDRLEIDLDGRVDAGYLVANGELRDLPIGSTLDGARGRFAWMPPAGYLGTYELVFISGSEKATVRVTVHGEPAAPVVGSGGGVRVALDSPAAGAISGSPLTIAGWAFDPDAWWEAGIRAVQVWATPLSGVGLPVFAGEATLGLYRADVAAADGDQFSRSGFNLVTSALRRGQYELSINVWSDRAGQWEVARKVRVTIR